MAEHDFLASAGPGFQAFQLAPENTEAEWDEDPSADPHIPPIQRITTKVSNILPNWGDKDTMNLNSLVLENVIQSPYFRTNLHALQTYHEILTEINFSVSHLEPWERGTRKVTGMTGMCGGVRGVGAGGIVSSAYCLLFKLFTIRLTRKQLCGLINHDNAYIRGLGFMYIRYCQPPADLWAWFEPYLEDPDEIDPKSGGGDQMPIGQMIKILMTKLDWYGTLFPRIPVPIQKELERNFAEYRRRKAAEAYADEESADNPPTAYHAASKHDTKSSHYDARHKSDRGKGTYRCRHHRRHHHCRKHRSDAKRPRVETEVK